MKRGIASSIFALCLGIAGMAQAATATLDKTIVGFASPESVVVAGNDVFVSNVGAKLDPFAKDGDGFISRLDRQGKVKTLRWQSDLNAPKGLIVVNGVLYAADIDRVLGWRIADGKQVFMLDLAASGSRFLNAFTALPGHRLLLSATDLGKVFVIHLRESRYEELRFDVPPSGPNGLKVRGQTLSVVEWGRDDQPNGKVRQYRLDGNRATQTRTYDLTPSGYLDGVVDLGGQRLLVSNWVKMQPTAGILQLLDTRTGRRETVRSIPFGGPADMTLDGDTLWVPGMMEGKVYRLRLSPR